MLNWLVTSTCNLAGCPEVESHLCSRLTMDLDLCGGSESEDPGREHLMILNILLTISSSHHREHKSDHS